MLNTTAKTLSNSVKFFIAPTFFLIYFSMYSNAQVLNEFQGTGSGVNVTSSNYNTFYGDSTGTQLTNQLGQNTFVGFGAGKVNTTNEITAVGYHAGYSNTTGFDNTFMGWKAGEATITGGDNTFYGTEAGLSNTTGYDNTFVGEESGQLNTTGYENTFIGEDAGFSNTTGYKQVFVGNEAGISAGTGYRNVAVGSEAMSDVSTGHHNTSIGDSAAIDVGAGVYNTMVGAASGVATEHADFNTFVGARSGWDNNRTNSITNANRNTYVGYQSGAENREGEDNVGIGALAGFTQQFPVGWGSNTFDGSASTNRNRTIYIGAASVAANNDIITMGYHSYNRGRYAIGIGNESDLLSANGAIMMGYQSMATDNADSSVGIGFQANIAQMNAVGIGRNVDVDNANAVAIGAKTIIQGDQGIAIGSGAQVTAANSIAIGFGANVSTSNEVYIGNSSITSIGGSVNWTALSDGRFKTNLKEDVPGLDFIRNLRPVTYNYDPNKMVSFRNESGNLDGDAKRNTRYTGFIAQEVEATALELGFDFSGVDAPENTETGMYGIRYAEFVVPLVKAVQELEEKVEYQQQIIDQQIQMLAAYEASTQEDMSQTLLIQELLNRVKALENEAKANTLNALETTSVTGNNN